MSKTTYTQGQIDAFERELAQLGCDLTVQHLYAHIDSAIECKEVAEDKEVLIQISHDLNIAHMISAVLLHKAQLK